MVSRYAYPIKGNKLQHKQVPRESKLHDGLLTTAGFALKAENSQRLERNK